jgi:pimeloyl-ACP methyl ester carboxylesterase
MSQTTWTDRRFETDGIRFRVVVGPAVGPPLILLHGVTRSWRDWLPLSSRLASRWQLIGLDFRGHGASGRAPSAKYHVRDYQAEVVGLIRSLVNRPCILVGHSLGAMVAAAVAAELPDRVVGVIMEDPPFDTMGERIGETVFFSQFVGLQRLLGRPWDEISLAQALGDLILHDPKTGSSFRLGDRRDEASRIFHASCLLRMDRAVLDPIVAGTWLEGYQRESLMRQIACPSLLLQADPAAGGMLTDADAADCRAWLRDPTFVRFDGVSHLIHTTTPEGWWGAVKPFLEPLFDIASRP